MKKAFFLLAAAALIPVVAAGQARQAAPAVKASGLT